MTWYIHKHVTRAVIDNRIRGMVTGAVRLAQRTEPLRLDLQGNAWSDLAGCLVWIENLTFGPGSLDGLATEQRGVCGDLTATRPARCPVRFPRETSRVDPSAPPRHVRTAGIYLEWFSERNGRVVIELADCRLCVSERAWQPTLDEQSEPAWCNLHAIEQFLQSRSKGFESHPDGRGVS